MARVKLIDEDQHPELARLINQIKQGRRGSLINVYRLLLLSPELAETWFAHLNAVRWRTQMSGRLREILIIRVGVLTETAYILRQHAPKLAAAEGLDDAACAALRESWPAGDFSEAERAAIAYADAMTRNITVDDPIFASLSAHYSERQIVDITVLIATYNMHARVINALRLDLEPLEPTSA